MSYEPNGVENQCQCVRSHFTMIDKSIRQCTGRAVTNGLCSECFRVHGQALVRKRSNESA